METCGEEWSEVPLTVRLQLDIGSCETADICHIEIGCVSDATFEFSKQISLRAKVAGTYIARVVVLMLLSRSWSWGSEKWGYLA